MVAFVCLAVVGASRGGEGARNIEVVPLHGTSMDTNFDQSSSADSQSFKDWSPHAPHSIHLDARPAGNTPLPRPQTSTANTERERELLDRRRNWVFMTPEEYASPDGKNGLESKDDNKQPTTAMERYYQRMNESDHVAVTNGFNRLEATRWNSRNNFTDADVRLPDQGVFAEVPFNGAPETQVFQSLKRGGFAAEVFGSDTRETLRSPESIRIEAEQKAHMDSFKQLWNIDQPPAPVPVISTPSTPVDSGPLFDLSSPEIHTINPENPFTHNSSSQSQAPETPAVTPRMTRPPHSDFSAPQRPF